MSNRKRRSGLSVSKAKHDKERGFLNNSRPVRNNMPYDYDDYERGKEMDDLYGFSMMDWGHN